MPRPARTATGPPARPARVASEPAPPAGSAPHPTAAGPPRRGPRSRHPADTRPGRRSRRAPSLTTSGPPTRAANASTSSTLVASANLGTGAPSASSRRRITSLSWACTSASGDGATRTPSATSFSSNSVGTCSWSNVTTHAPSATRRSASRSSWLPSTTSGVTCAAGSSGIDGEHAQRLTQRDRGLVRHPGELTSADHRHHGQSRPDVLRTLSWCHAFTYGVGHAQARFTYTAVLCPSPTRRSRASRE